MKNFDDFITQIGSDLPPLPQEVYGKVRLRIVGERYVLPALFTVPVLILAGVFLLAPKPQTPIYDFLSQTEEVFFIDEEFYSLLD